jgi:hypothetical protein
VRGWRGGSSALLDLGSVDQNILDLATGFLMLKRAFSGVITGVFGSNLRE